ncbi:integrase [Ralstonia solanacearum]|nr:integrase [Ralstonia solanacearum]
MFFRTGTTDKGRWPTPLCGQALRKLGWATKYSPHGTRTTGSTRLNEMGYRPDAIEAQLAHAKPNSVRRSYNHATYLDERWVMMQDWVDQLEAWKLAARAGG